MSTIKILMTANSLNRTIWNLISLSIKNICLRLSSWIIFTTAWPFCCIIHFQFHISWKWMVATWFAVIACSTLSSSCVIQTKVEINGTQLVTVKSTWAWQTVRLLCHTWNIIQHNNYMIVQSKFELILLLFCVWHYKNYALIEDI